MNREIKFRIWDDNLGMCLNPIIGDDKPVNINEAMNENAVGKVMQYAGLKDETGKDIYESDIIYLAGYGNYTVEFPFIELYMAAAENDIGKIIGNIYEHKHLLKNE